jgi:ubiquinone biosynthesis protein UbiJ
VLERFLESVFDRVLGLDPEWQESLAPLLGRTVAVRVEPYGPWLTLRITPEGVRTVHEGEGSSDLRLSGSLAALLDAARGGGSMPSGLTVNGDLGLLQAVRRHLGRLELDWEEALARPLGDVAGRQVARALRVGFQWGREASDALARDMVEYLGEEAGLAVTRWPVERFLEQVDTLRDDVERVAQRIERLERGARGGDR